MKVKNKSPNNIIQKSPLLSKVLATPSLANELTKIFSGKSLSFGINKLSTGSSKIRTITNG